jgi:prepilin-type N-terminal cleavage/methylation domain-containing protein
MVPKYTILKAIIQSFSKVPKSKQGFTLLELIVGMSIMLIVGGLAMNAFIQASTTFNKDKKSIDSSQSMSVILEMIGNDIKQSGENISAGSFPTIEFKVADAILDPTLKTGSSKIIVRRALTDSLTLCEAVPIASDPTTITSLIVADNLPATVTASANCNAGTSSSKLFAARPSTEYELTATTDPVPTPALDLVLPKALRKVRDYRCQLDDPNPTVAYDAASRVTDNFCDSSALEVTRIAVSNLSGQFLIFNQTNETVDSANTATAKKYGITVNTTGLGSSAVVNNEKNKAVAYPIGSPIYVIEERYYALTTAGELQVSLNGETPTTLVKKIENFRVSARTYTNTTDRIVQPTPAANICTDATPFAAQPTTASENSPKYICQFNYFTGVATTDNADWKGLSGIKVEIQTKYDGRGQNATPTTEDTRKLYAASEFFPRNVLSK